MAKFPVATDASLEFGPEPRSKGASERMKIALEEFNRLTRGKQFSVGPFMDTLGDGPGEPYNPYRRVWGTLVSGVEVESNTDPKWKPTT